MRMLNISFNTDNRKKSKKKIEKKNRKQFEEEAEKKFSFSHTKT